MKAHVQSKQEKLSLLEKEEIMRINKIWMLTLNQVFGFGAERLVKAFSAVCKYSGNLYEDPEYWQEVDHLLVDKMQFGDFIEREDLEEREKTMLEVHRANGKKWRDY